LAHGDLGYSVSKQGPVSRSIAETLPRTLALTGLSLVLSLLLGVIIGTPPSGATRWLVRSPELGLLAVLLFTARLLGCAHGTARLRAVVAALSGGGMVEEAVHDYLAPWPAFLDRLRHLVLPVASFTLLTLAGIARYQRAAMLEVLPSDFVRNGARERST
jgi:peptide/nickel transport system permease protein